MVNNVWTPEADQRLFLAVLRVQNITVDYAAVAADLGTTTSAVTQRIFKLRKAARENSPSSAVGAQRNGRNATASTTTRQPRSSRARTSKARAKPSVKEEKPEQSNARPARMTSVARGGAVVEPKEEVPDRAVNEAEEHGTEANQIPVLPTASMEAGAAISLRTESNDAAPKMEPDGTLGFPDPDEDLLGGSFTMLDADDMCDGSPLSMRTIGNLLREGCGNGDDNGGDDGVGDSNQQATGSSLPSSGRKRARQSISPSPLPVNRLLWGGSKKRTLAARKSAPSDQQVDLADIFKDAPALVPTPAPSVPVNVLDTVASSSGTNDSLVLFGEESHRGLGGLAE